MFFFSLSLSPDMFSLSLCLSPVQSCFQSIHTHYCIRILCRCVYCIKPESSAYTSHYLVNVTYRQINVVYFLFSFLMGAVTATVHTNSTLASSWSHVHRMQVNGCTRGAEDPKPLKYWDSWVIGCVANTSSHAIDNCCLSSQKQSEGATLFHLFTK